MRLLKEAGSDYHDDEGKVYEVQNGELDKNQDFIEGMKQSGLDYEDGTILDPESGKIYHASMHLSPDGTKLTVRGYIGLSIFGRSQIWNRVQ